MTSLRGNRRFCLVPANEVEAAIPKCTTPGLPCRANWLLDVRPPCTLQVEQPVDRLSVVGDHYEL